MTKRSSRIRTDAPRCNRLGRRGAGGSLTGKLVEIETLLADPQVEVEQGDGDRLDGDDERVDQRGHRRDDARPDVAVEPGDQRRSATEERGQRRLDKRAHEGNEDQE